MKVIVRSKVPQVKGAVVNKVEKAVQTAAFGIESEGKSRAPVDTGYLRNAINANGKSMNWQVDSPAEYSLYQEMGTRFIGPHPFLVPALETWAPKLKDSLKRLV